MEVAKWNAFLTGQADWQVYGSGNWIQMENGTGTSLVMTGLQAQHLWKGRAKSRQCPSGISIH